MAGFQLNIFDCDQTIRPFVVTLIYVQIQQYIYILEEIAL